MEIKISQRRNEKTESKPEPTVSMKVGRIRGQNKKISKDSKILKSLAH
jgi:hypothetical protein